MHLLAVFDSASAAPPREMVVTIEADAATPEAAAAAVECAASAALDALAAAADADADAAAQPPTITCLSPGVGFAAQGADVAEAPGRAALYVGAPPPPGWGVEQEEEEAEGRVSSGAERTLSLLASLSGMLPDDAVEAAKDALAALSEATTAAEGGSGGGGEGFALVAFDAAAAPPGAGGAATGASTLLAARDMAGKAPLYWGTTPAGLLLIGADPADLGDCFPTAVPFPAGALFVSTGGGPGGEAGRAEPGDLGFIILPDDAHAAVPAPAPGRLASFVRGGGGVQAPGGPGRPPRGPPSYRAVRSVPRVNSAGALCGAVFRVASEGESLVDLTGAGRPRAGRA